MLNNRIAQLISDRLLSGGDLKISDLEFAPEDSKRAMPIDNIGLITLDTFYLVGKPIGFCFGIRETTRSSDRYLFHAKPASFSQGGEELTEEEMLSSVYSWARRVREERRATNPWAEQTSPFDFFSEAVGNENAEPWRKLNSDEVVQLNSQLEQMRGQIDEFAQRLALNEEKTEALRAALLDTIDTLEKAAPYLSKADLQAVVDARRDAWTARFNLMAAAANIAAPFVPFLLGSPKLP